MTARPPPGSDDADMYSASTVAAEAPADLLDLVRAAEEAATVTTKAPSERMPAAGTEEVVDVGDEAVDAPPSLAPLASAPPADTAPAKAAASPASRAREDRTEKRRPTAHASAPEQGNAGKPMPPALAIVGLLGLAAAVLAFVTRV